MMVPGMVFFMFLEFELLDLCVYHPVFPVSLLGIPHTYVRLLYIVPHCIDALMFPVFTCLSCCVLDHFCYCVCKATNHFFFNV